MLLCLESRWCVTMEILKQCRQSLGEKLHKHKADKLFRSFLGVFLSSCLTMSDRGETMTEGEPEFCGWGLKGGGTCSELVVMLKRGVGGLSLRKGLQWLGAQRRSSFVPAQDCYSTPEQILLLFSLLSSPQPLPPLVTHSHSLFSPLPSQLSRKTSKEGGQGEEVEGELEKACAEALLDELEPEGEKRLILFFVQIREADGCGP